MVVKWVKCSPSLLMIRVIFQAEVYSFLCSRRIVWKEQNKLKRAHVWTILKVTQKRCVQLPYHYYKKDYFCNKDHSVNNPTKVKKTFFLNFDLEKFSLPLRDPFHWEKLKIMVVTIVQIVGLVTAGISSCL